MKEGLIHKQVIVVAHDQTAVVAQPGKGAFHLPAVAVAAQPASIVECRLGASPTVRSNQQHTLIEQTLPQGIAVVSTVGNDAQGFLAMHLDARKGRFDQLYFRRAGAGKLASQRNTRAVDHHHPLRSFAALGFSDAEAPFLAEAKLPSTKLSLQSSRPRLSSSRRKTRHISSHTPRSSHVRRRLQHVAAEGYCSGISRQRAPVLSTQRMPSSTCRLSAHGRPLLRTLGNSGSIRFHCSSVRNLSPIPSFPPQMPHKVQTFLSVTAKNL